MTALTGGQADGIGRACLRAFKGEADGYSAFTGGGCDALDRAAVHVADGEFACPGCIGRTAA